MNPILSPHARLLPGNGGLMKIAIDHPAAAGEIYLHGGHVTHWQPAGQGPVIYVSPLAQFASGKAIRGGIPICLPWFGPLAAASGAPAHGLVRTREWTLVDAAEDDDGVTVRLRFDSPVNVAPYWDNAFAAELAVTFGQSLSISLNVINTGDIAMAFDEALHTYYHVGDVRQITVAGLHNTSYLDKPTGGKAMLDTSPAIRFAGEVDRVYIDSDTTCVISDPVLHRTISIEKFLSHSTVVWNPAERRAAELADLGAENWPNFVCVETANIGDDGIKLVAGGSHEMICNVTVDSM